MKIALTGANGMLGTALAEACILREWPCRAINRDSILLHSPSAAVELFLGADVVIHAAANTDVEFCEQHRDVCYRDNTVLTEVIARAATLAGSRFVYISSTGVYGNHKRAPYDEFDLAAPTTIHHQSKHLAEAVSLLQPGCLVVRTGWLFGGTTRNPKNFVARRIYEAKNTRAAIRSNFEQFGNPSFSRDVAGQILRLIEDGHSGVFNCVNEESVSRAEYVRTILADAGLKTPVEDCPAATFRRSAPVSLNEGAVNLKMNLMGISPMRSWRVALREYLGEIL